LVRKQIEVLQIAEGYFGSQILFTAHELGIFDRLAQEPQSAAVLSRAVGGSEDHLERFLNAAVAIGLLRFETGRYVNGDLASAVLVSDQPGYIGNWLRLMSRWMRAWLHLKDSILTGDPAEDPQLHLGGDPSYTRDFTMGMHDYAQVRGGEIIHHLDFAGYSRLLDLGGGPGTYAILFAKQWPDLRITIFDLPEVARIASANCARAGAESQITVVPGNYHTDEVGRDYDVVFLSDALHQENAEDCKRLLEKAHRALRPGGRLVVQGMFLNEDRLGPRWSAMYSLILLLFNGSGRAYTVNETIRLMESAGFGDCGHLPMSLFNVNSLIFAQKA
jgi:SAM-dependent methyltransferase